MIPARPVFQWNNYESFIGVGGNNLLPTNWGTNALTGGSYTGWNVGPHATAYQNATNLALHVTGFDNSEHQDDVDDSLRSRQPGR